jgi:integrase
MKRGLPPYVYPKKGAIYFQRRGFPTVRITSAQGTPEFHAEYARLLAGERPIYAGPRVFSALVREYVASPKYRNLSIRTVQDYDKVLEWVTAKLGPLPVAAMQRKDVIRAQSTNADRVRFANYIVQVLRILFEHSIDLGWRKDNPAKGVSLITSSKPAREAWPQGLVDAFRAKAEGRTLLIFELCIGTGQRIADVLKMRWGDIEGDCIMVKQGKTGAKLAIPITPRLGFILAATPRIGLTMCAWGPAGKPTLYRTAADLIMAVRRQIGAEGYDIHGLRYFAAAELAEAGCSDELIMAITGHRTIAMVAKYAGPARQRSRAQEAQDRRK